MSSSRKIRVGVAGLGRIGSLHAENIAGRIPFAELASVVDADASRAEEYGNRYGVPWGVSTDDILSDQSIDAIVIATPTPDHPRTVLAAAAAGKAVFCEKPLGLDEAETVSIIEEVESLGGFLQVGLHRRFDPDAARVKSLIAENTLGEVYSFQTSLRDMYPQPMEYIRQSGSFFVDVSIHDLDVARWLIGEITEVSVFGSSVSDPEYEKLGTVDHAVIVVRFENGALGVLDNSRIAGYGYESSTEIVGSLAAARIDASPRSNVSVLADASSCSDHVIDFVERFHDAYRNEIVEFVRSIREGLPPQVTGSDALAAFVLGTACDRAFTTGKTVQLNHELTSGGVRYSIVNP